MLTYSIQKWCKHDRLYIGPKCNCEWCVKDRKNEQKEPTKCSECPSFGICTETMDYNCTKPYKTKE